MRSPGRADDSARTPGAGTGSVEAPSVGGHFDPVLSGRCDRLIRGDGVVVPLAPRRWDSDANEDDQWILDRCSGPTLDLGCGPGRLVVALAARGVSVLGVDLSPHAIARCNERGATVVRRDVLGPLPHEGRWAHVVLADGNIGIGGDPVHLLRRCRALLGNRGSVIVELQPEADLWEGLARVDAPVGDTVHQRDPDGADHAHDRGIDPGPSWFWWAMVGTDAVAARAGLDVIARSAPHRTRSFAELAPS